MKVLLVNGSPNQNGCTFTALSEAAKTLNEEGVETELFWIGKKPLSGCIACYSCVKTGKCVFQDQTNEIGARIDEFDGIVVGSPVYYGGPNGRLTSFLDRLFFSTGALDKTMKAGASVVVCRRGGASASFDARDKF